MSPIDEKMIRVARQQAQEYATNHGISTDRKMAETIGVSRSTYSEFMSGTYSGNMEKVAQKVMALVAKYRDERLNDDVVQTKTFKRIREVLKKVRGKHELAALIGSAGIGKTFTLEHWCLEDEDAVYILINGAFTKGELLRQVARRLGQRVTRDYYPENMEMIRSALHEHERTIIIDQADRLSLGKLELLQDIYDTRKCSMVLAGIQRLGLILQYGKSMKENVAQLYSRIGYWRELEDIDTADVQEILSARKFPAVKKETLEWLANRVHTAGGVRTLMKAVDRALELAEDRAIKPDDKLLTSAFQFLPKGAKR